MASDPPPSVQRRLSHEGTTGFLAGGGALPRPRPRRRHVLAGVRLVLVAAAGLALGAGVSSGALGPAGRALGRFLDFYAGVVSLVGLSLAVMVGLLATGRVVPSRHRLTAQIAHRVFAFVAVVSLGVHIATQLLRHRVGALAAFVPAGTAGHALSLALGVVACYLMVVAVAGGIVRGRFAEIRRPWLWRVLHLTAYVAWPAAVAHGLTCGRPAAVWVTGSYLLCLAAVAAGIAVRPLLRPAESRRPS
ncbi:hypothetical protein [Actinomadura rupiterrae]|uniref:hypothetical protein n=1 Tax=Actinomadura rupiterrae TaxID=559627 RepID=UPI0020A48610|nr:hypothetical protein [Actinomadura rupiterrae]MCP2340992.1 putative membrane protein required for colicin V production [Actinomadura rupiterrae]